MKALLELKRECFNRVAGDYCFCCENQKSSVLVLHHLSYTENSVTYNKFENSPDGRLKYYVSLLDEIKQDPNNFLVLCMDCHQVIENLLKMKWIDAYNFCNENKGEKYQYYNAWDMSFKKRKEIQYHSKFDEIIPKKSELEDFFR